MDTFEGLMCRVFQHEMDHMNGIDFMSRAKKMDLNIAKRKLKRGKLKLKNLMEKICSHERVSRIITGDPVRPHIDAETRLAR